MTEMSPEPEQWAVEDGPDLSVDEPIEPDHRASRNRSSPFKNLGRNKTATGRAAKPRQLKQNDITRLAGWYEMLAMAMMPFNARAASACMDSGMKCAEAWADLAKDNDNVRRAVLALLEGGAWGGVFMAHMPIMLAFVPQDMLDRFGFQEVQQESENSGEDT